MTILHFCKDTARWGKGGQQHIEWLLTHLYICAKFKTDLIIKINIA